MSSDQPLFDATLEILSELYRSQQLFITLLPPFSVEFEIDEQSTAKVLDARVTERQFRTEAQEIGIFLLAHLEGDVEAYIEGRSNRQGGPDRAVLTQRAAAVRDAFWSEGLQSRYQLKVTSKAPAFAGLDWDIKIKLEDAKVAGLNLPYATCKLRFQREFEDSPYTVISGRVFDAVQVNFTKDEIDYVLRVFQVVRDRLQALQGSGEST